MEESGLCLNKDKCKLKRARLSYFGNVIDKDGVSPSDEKVRLYRNSHHLRTSKNSNST